MNLHCDLYTTSLVKREPLYSLAKKPLRSLRRQTLSVLLLLLVMLLPVTGVLLLGGRVDLGWRWRQLLLLLLLLQLGHLPLGPCAQPLHLCYRIRCETNALRDHVLRQALVPQVAKIVVHHPCRTRSELFLLLGLGLPLELGLREARSHTACDEIGKGGC